MKQSELCDSIIISAKSIIDDAKELKLKEGKIRADERAKTLIEIIDFIKYECCLEDRITKVLDKAEELKEQSNERD